MLYCPRCQQTYETDSKGFCTLDGARLLPLPTTVVQREKESKAVAPPFISSAEITNPSETPPIVPDIHIAPRPEIRDETEKQFEVENAGKSPPTLSGLHKQSRIGCLLLYFLVILIFAAAVWASRA